MCRYNLLNGYVGAKASYAAKIKSLFDPNCTKYGEPFAGGASIFFSMPYGEYEVESLNERNGSLANLYDLLSKKEISKEVVESILQLKKPDDNELARENFIKAREELKANYDLAAYRGMNMETRVRYAVSTFLVYSQSFNCSGENYSENRNSERYQNETRRNLINAVERLQGCKELKICGTDGITLLERKEVREDESRQLYIDPPYVGLYRDCAKLYRVELAELKSHIRLARALNGCKCAVVLSGYRSQIEGVPTIYDAILGDQWKCFKLADTYKHCEIVKQGQKKSKAEEYVWTNRVPEDAKNYFLLEDFKEKLSFDEYWKRIKKAEQKGLLVQKARNAYETAYFEIFGKKLFENAV